MASPLDGRGGEGVRARGRPRTLLRLALAGAVALGALSGGGLAAAATPPDLGPNVLVFDPSMPTSEIQAQVDAIASQQIPNQFGTERYALLFKPGTYGTPEQPLNFQVGYYTEVAGLGALPTDVHINGTIDVYNQCLGEGNCIALVNFWRSLSNLTIDVAGKSGCQAGEFWAVSQAAPMRRVEVNGNTTLMDYCSAPSYASGGFIADSLFTGNIVNGSQQQFLVRNSVLNGWSNGVWNQVFSGVTNAPPTTFPDQSNGPYTTLATTPASREKPFLYVDGHGDYQVYVPAVQHDSSGVSWASGQTPGESIGIERFFIAHPGDSVDRINQALRRRNVLFTPGIYTVDKPIRVSRPDTVVLGLGMATLEVTNGTIGMAVGNVPGVSISGLLFDAGAVNSPTLLRVGQRPHGGGSVDDPTALHDVFFRIGGAHVGKATVSLKVNSDDVILDHIWAWRADHGDGVGWDSNTADTGLIVNGDGVLATGLFVEHYQKYEVIWNGNDGETIMFQNEMPYDPPNQAAWRHKGVLGFASYKVADSVTTHQGYGLGVYCFFNVDPSIHATRAFEVPVTPGVQLHDILDLSINSGTIDHIVNDTGPPTPPGVAINPLVSFP